MTYDFPPTKKLSLKSANALGVPYIEVQDGEDALEPGNAAHGPLATVMINGDVRTSYDVALGIALKQLRA
jgi:3-dehydroquinate dehydratase-2